MSEIQKKNTQNEEALIRSLYVPKSPSFTRRIAAFILDFISVLIVAIGVGYLTATFIGYDKTQKALDAKYVEYQIKEYNDEGKLIISEASDEILAIRWNQFEQDEEACRLWDEMVDKTLPIPIVGITMALLIFELIVPLCLKNGRTIGMYVFKISLITKEDIQVKFKNIFIRFLFGKLLVNAILPILCFLMFYFNRANFIIVCILMTILLSNLFLLISSKRHITVPDYFGSVFPCDTEGQFFFETIDELNHAKCEEAKRLERRKRTY